MAGNAFDAADQGEFLRSEKDTRPYWETQHRAFLAPLVMSGYNNSVSYGVPSMLGGGAWGVLDDILRGRSVAKGEVEAAAGDAANGAMVGSFGMSRPAGSIGSGGRPKSAELPAREVDPLGFYSQALETAKTLQPKAPIEQYLAAMRNKGVKQAEIDAMNIANAFEPGKPVTRDELVDMLRKKRVELRETRYGAPANYDAIKSRMLEISKQQDALRASGDRGQMTGVEAQRLGIEMSKLKEQLRDAPEAHFDGYTLDPGNATYHEAVLSLPTAEQAAQKAIDAVRAKYNLKPGDGWGKYANEQERAHIERLQEQAIKDDGKPMYDGSHFEQPNVIGHTMNELAQTPDGRRAYVPTQVQSDWGQALREGGGPRDPEQIARVRQQFEAADQAYYDQSTQNGRLRMRYYRDLLEPRVVGEPTPFGERTQGITNPNGEAMWFGRHPVTGVMEYPIEVGPWTGEITYWPKTFDHQGREAGPGYTANYASGMYQNLRGNSIDELLAAIRENNGRLYDERALDALAAAATKQGNQAAAQELTAAREAYRLATDERNRLRGEFYALEEAPTGHPLVNTTDQWLNTTLRRMVRNAIDQNADVIAVPTGDTVLGYNPGQEHGMNAFYNTIVPKNLAAILAKLDKEGVRRSYLQSIHTPNRHYAGEGFNVFDITPKMREEALKGMPMFTRGIPVPVPAPAPMPYDPTIY